MRSVGLGLLLAGVLLPGLSCGGPPPEAQKIYFVPIGEVASMRLDAPVSAAGWRSTGG